jgi:phage gp29-like protein
VRQRELKREIAGPTLSGVRSPLTSYPADGLNPQRLAAILRDADAGDPIRQLELAEFMEERDNHYLGVLSTRRRSVTQLDITVKDGGDDPLDKRIAEEIRDWIARDELADEMYDILDAIGKGYSFTEIIWEASARQWYPVRLEFRDPRWFRFDRRDLRTPVMLDETGQEIPLPAYKFIHPRISAKSGITPRSGLCRAVAWAYLFKKFTERDWSIFTQTYGQPVRLGRYPGNATEAERDTLFRAVANIAADCAAIVPESMAIEFIEAGQVGASTDLYERRADWYDKQVSKAVLGQTATTDAETGGLGSGAEHRMVQEDIERADAKALSAVLTRDLVRPFVDLNYPGHGRYPKIVIARPEAEDLKATADAVGVLVDRGFEVDQADFYEKFGLRPPTAGAKLLRPAGQSSAIAAISPADGDGTAPESRIKPPFNTRQELSAAPPPKTPGSRPAGLSGAPVEMADRLAIEADPLIGAILEEIEAMMGEAGSLEALRGMLREAFPAISTERLASVMAQAFLAAEMAGRAAVTDEADG